MKRAVSSLSQSQWTVLRGGHVQYTHVYMYVCICCFHLNTVCFEENALNVYINCSFDCANHSIRMPKSDFNWQNECERNISCSNSWKDHNHTCINNGRFFSPIKCNSVDKWQLHWVWADWLIDNSYSWPQPLNFPSSLARSQCLTVHSLDACTIFSNNRTCTNV